MSEPKKLVRRRNPASHGIRNLSIEEREPEREPQKEIRVVRRISEEEKRRIMERAKSPDVPHHSFPTNPKDYIKADRFNRISNILTASRYGPND